MRKYRGKSPEEIMRMVTTEIVGRAAYYSRKTHRTIAISKTSRGAGVDVLTLDPKEPQGAENLQEFLKKPKRYYTISGLGNPEEKDAVNWRNLNLSFGRRMLLLLQVTVSLFMKGTPFKNRLYRWMGVQVGSGTEIMQMAWLDHFRPELISIGDNTLLGAFTRVTVHAYEGSGRFRYGLVEIGSDCTIGAGTGIGPIKIGDGARTLPGTALSPYLIRVRPGSVVGWNPPHVNLPENEDEPSQPSRPA